MNCISCNVNVNEKPLFRVNPKGEKGIWKCEDCIDNKIDSAVKDIVDVINN